jgi:hypothetical protein
MPTIENEPRVANNGYVAPPSALQPEPTTRYGGHDYALLNHARPRSNALLKSSQRFAVNSYTKRALEVSKKFRPEMLRMEQKNLLRTREMALLSNQIEQEKLGQQIAKLFTKHAKKSDIANQYPQKNLQLAEQEQLLQLRTQQSQNEEFAVFNEKFRNNINSANELMRMKDELYEPRQRPEPKMALQPELKNNAVNSASARQVQSRLRREMSSIKDEYKEQKSKIVAQAAALRKEIAQLPPAIPLKKWETESRLKSLVVNLFSKPSRDASRYQIDLNKLEAKMDRLVQDEIEITTRYAKNLDELQSLISEFKGNNDELVELRLNRKLKQPNGNERS